MVRKTTDATNPFDEEELDDSSPYDEETEETPEEGDDLPEDGEEPEEESPSVLPEGMQDFEDFFHKFLDDRGSLPSFFDGVMAQTVTRQEGKDRDAFYSYSGKPRYEDYLPTLKEYAEMDKEDEEKNPEDMDVLDRIGKGMRIQATKAIRAWNDLTGDDIKDLEPIKSDEDDLLVSIVGSWGGAMAAGTVIGLSSPGWIVAGALSQGVIALHSYISTFDNPDNMELYEGFVSSAVGTSIITNTSSDISRAELATRIYLTALADTVAGFGIVGLAGKGLKAAGKGISLTRQQVAKRMTPEMRESIERAKSMMGEQGFLRFRSSSNKGKMPVPDMSMTDDEYDLYMRGIVDDVEDTIGDLRDVHFNPKVLDALENRRQFMQPVKDKRLTKAFMDDTERFYKDIDSRFDVDSFVRDAPSVENYGAAAGRAIDNLSRKGVSDKQKMKFINQYIGNMSLKHRLDPAAATRVTDRGIKRADVAADVAGRPLEDTYTRGTGDVGSLVDADTKAKFTIYDELLREEKKLRPNLEKIRALEAAYLVAARQGRVTVSAAGGSMQAWQAYEFSVNAVEKMERQIRSHYKMARNTVGRTSARHQKYAKRLEDSYRKRLREISKFRPGAAMRISATATRAFADNALGAGALMMALPSSVASHLYEGVYYGFKRGVIEQRNPFTQFGTLKRAKNIIKDRLKKRYGSLETYKQTGWREWTGEAPPKKARFMTHQIEPKTAFGKATNVIGGTSITAMRELDYNLSAVFETLNQQIALQRMVNGMFKQGKTAKEVRKTLQNAIKGEGDGAFDFVVAYDQEVMKTTDWQLMRADIEYGRGWLQDVGKRLYEWSEDLRMSRGAFSSYMGGTLGLFSRAFSNMFVYVSSNTWIDGWTVVSKNPEMINRKTFGSLFAFGSLFGLYGMTDNDSFIGVVEPPTGSLADDSLYRRFGGESGLRVGDTVHRWSTFGIFGEVTRAMMAFKDISELMVVDPALDAAGIKESKWPTHGYEDHVFMAAYKAMDYILGNGWIEMGLGQFLNAMTFSEEGLGKWLKAHGMKSIPGQSIVNRVGTATTEGSRSRTNNTPIDDFIKAVDQATPRAVRRDMFGVPWNKGEDREGTRENVDLVSRLIWFTNPAHRKGTPKGNILRDWILEAGGFNNKSILVGDRWIKPDRFYEGFKMKQTNMKMAGRTVPLLTGGSGYTLSPDEYNNKLGIMSLDFEYAHKVIDSYIYKIQSKGHTGQLGERASRNVRVLKALKETFSDGNMSDIVKFYYPNYKKNSRMIDVMYHIAIAPRSKLSYGLRAQIDGYVDAFKVSYRREELYNTSIPKFTEKELDDLADRTVRLSMMRQFYDTMDKMAGMVVQYCPEVDDENDAIYNKDVGGKVE